MPDTRIHAGECLDKRTVLAGPQSPECRRHDSNAETVTARLAPAASVWRGQGSAGSGSSRGSNLVLQFCQLAFKSIVGMEMRRDECCLGWIDRHPSAHQIGAGRQGQEVALDPIRRDDGIGIRCQKYAVGPASSAADCMASRRALPALAVEWPGRCGSGRAADTEGGSTAHWAMRSGAVDTVVGQQEDRIGLPGLPSERAEASRDTIDFVPGRDRDNGRTTGLMHRLSGHGSVEPRINVHCARFRPGPPSTCRWLLIGTQSLPRLRYFRFTAAQATRNARSSSPPYSSQAWLNASRKMSWACGGR